MGFFGSMDTSTSGLTAQRLRLDIISQNIANANTTRTAEGGPYKRKAVIFEAVNNTASFDNVLNKYTNSKNNGVRVSQIIEDNKAFPTQYDPNHPDADENGYVQLPNVNMVEEMVNMISASRSYEANVTAFNAMKAMASKALEIGK
jgi:flagellar basal-body rod protein FlgC